MEKDQTVCSGRIALECKAAWCGTKWPSRKKTTTAQNELKIFLKS
jgi:hypothetical protein